MTDMLGHPVREALSSLPEGVSPPRIVETAAPRRDGQPREGGTLRLICRRDGVWIAARFLDDTPRDKEG